MSEIKIKNSLGLMRRVYGLSPSVEEAIERFASTSEENRLTVEEAKKLIKGQGYVRTKSRIYRLASLKDGKALVWKGYELVCIKESSILRKSDSLEDLFDFLVWEWRHERRPQIVDADHAFIKVTKQELAGSDLCTVYGAVHVKGKGLNYAAVLREEGEFELL